MDDTTTSANVAVIVPVLHDTDALAVLVAAIAGWRHRPAEIVVVSAGKDAGVAELCRAHGCRYVEAPASRGAQLDAGARLATAAVLWFLHADARVPADGIEALAAALRAGAESGCFAFEFQGPRTRTKTLLERLVRLRVRCGGIPYGDQGLFVRRDAYDACGGFPHQPLFEEVRLVKRLRGRGTFRTLSARIAVATRRWERDGWWRRSVRNRWLAVCYMLGVPAERLARAYGPPARTPAHGH